MDQKQLDAYHGHLEFSRLKVTRSRFVQPWERGFMKIPNSPFAVSPPAPTDGGILLASSLVKKRSAQELAPHEYELLGSFFKKFRTQSLKKNKQSWVAKLDYDRKAAFIKWEKIMLCGLLDFEAGVQFRMMRLANRVPNFQQYFMDVFAIKSTLTLHKRANPVLRFVKWCQRDGGVAIPFQEDRIYAFLTDSTETFAPTFGKSFTGSLGFMYYVLGSKSAKLCVESKRIIGCASRMYLQKRKLKQKSPLLVKQVIGLEKICNNEVDATLEEKVASGFFLFMVFARARHSDAQSAGSIFLDLVEGEDGVDGFVEASVGRSKTSYSLERKTRFLPMSAQIRGIQQHDSWAINWFKHMDKAKLPRGKDLPLLPAPLRDGTWGKLPLSAEASGAWLRHLLLKVGTQKSDLLQYGTHTLKTTTLAWLAKRGVARETRAALGYHAKAVDGTEVVYGRDNMAAPLRVLSSVVAEVVDGVFKPDATKSGMLSRNARPTSDLVNGPLFMPSGISEVVNVEKPLDPDLPEDVATGGEQSDISSEDSNDESEPDHDAIEDAIASVVGRWCPVSEVFDESSVVYVRHSLSRMIHVAADEYSEKFMCGRELSGVYFKLTRKPEVFHPMCAQCLKSLQKHAKSVKQT